MNTKQFFSTFAKDGKITLVVNGVVSSYDETDFNRIQDPYRLVPDHVHYRTSHYIVEKVT